MVYKECKHSGKKQGNMKIERDKFEKLVVFPEIFVII